MDPRPLEQRRIGVVAFPGERREPEQTATLPIHTDDRRTLHRELVRRDRLGEREDIVLRVRVLDPRALLLAHLATIGTMRETSLANSPRSGARRSGFVRGFARTVL